MSDSYENLERLIQLMQASQDLIASIEKWTSELADTWSRKATDLDNISRPHKSREYFELSIPIIPRPSILDHHDVWLAYKLNCHSASQIVFRESLVDLIKYRARIQNQELDQDSLNYNRTQVRAVGTLSTAIIQSYPSFLGFTHKNSEETLSPIQGRMAGRLFSIFPMWVIQRAQYTSDGHKRIASDVTEWINYRHGLG